MIIKKYKKEQKIEYFIRAIDTDKIAKIIYKGGY